MKIGQIDIEKAINEAREILSREESVSPALKASVDLLIAVITMLVDQLSLNSKNSSIPPSADPNRKKRPRSSAPKKKPGGQKDHPGATLLPVKDPDKVKPIAVDRSKLPEGEYRVAGYESRQVIDIIIARHVTEYRAEILEDAYGRRFTADFPEGVARPVQYGDSVRGHAVYLSQYQLLPYDRIAEYFDDQADIPISKGTLFNFNRAAFELLEPFENAVKKRLKESPVCHADETGINVNGKRSWLHCVSNDSYTLFQAHPKRGRDAFDDMGVIPYFSGVLCHDHWKPYFSYNCLHALCNAHLLRELDWSKEEDKQKWAEEMAKLLVRATTEVDRAGGALSPAKAEDVKEQYRSILKAGQIECPPPDPPPKEKRKRGRQKRSKSRNLLERFIDFETEILRFLEDPLVPFTNNLAERDIRMTKVHQKISGCFRSWDGARIFCRIRSYLSTCKKNGIHASEAMEMLYKNELPAFLID